MMTNGPGLQCRIPLALCFEGEGLEKGTEKFNRGAIYDQATYHKTMSY